MGVDQLSIIIEGIEKYESPEAANALLAIAQDKSNLGLLMTTPQLLGKVIDAVEDQRNPLIIAPLVSFMMILCHYEQFI